jgi:hypothetical protein
MDIVAVRLPRCCQHREELSIVVVVVVVADRGVHTTVAALLPTPCND